MSVAVVLAVSANTDDFHFLHLLKDTALDTTGRDGATTFNVKHVFHWHEERQINRTLRHGDVIVDRGDERENLLLLLGVAVKRLQGAAFDDRDFVTRKFILREQIANFHLHEIEKLRIIHHVDLVQEDHDGRHADLAGQKNVLARLRHGAVSCAHDEDGAVHLRRARDHVLHIIGVAGAVDVRVVALVALIFNVGGVDRNAALFFFGRIIDRIVGTRFRETFLGQHAGDSGGQSGFTMVDVTDCADVQVRLIAFECFLSHWVLLSFLNKLRLGKLSSCPRAQTGAHDRD